MGCAEFFTSERVSYFIFFVDDDLWTDLMLLSPRGLMLGPSVSGWRRQTSRYTSKRFATEVILHSIEQDQEG